MKTFYILFIVTFLSCHSKDDGVIQSIYETDTTSIQYSFVDLKQIIISNVKDTVNIEIMLRNLTDTILYSNPIQSIGSYEYVLDIFSEISDTSTFKIEFSCGRKDSTGLEKKSMFRRYFGKNVQWLLMEYIQRGKLNFYRRYEAPYIKLTDTTMILKIAVAELPKHILKSIEKNLTVRTTYYWPDTLCEKVKWCDYLQNSNTDINEKRGYIRTHCYADGFISGPQNDTIIASAPYDRK